MTRRRGADSPAKRVPWKWIGAALAAGALFAAWRLLPVEDWLQRFQQWVEGLGAAGGFLFGLIYVVAALLFVPGSLLTLAAGVAFGMVWGTVIVSLSATLAAAAAFLIARYAARPRVEKLARRNQKFGAVDRAIEKNGWKVVALLRLSPVVPFSLSNYLYGLTAIRFLPYVLTSWLAMLPGTFLYVYLGSIGRGLGSGGRRTTGEWVLLGAGLAATAIVTVVLARVARKELKKEDVGGKRI